MKKKVKYRSVEFWVESMSKFEEEFWEDYSTNKWETTNLDFMLNNIRGGYFLDIGAWVGPVSLLMSQFYEKVIAVDFDPVSNNAFKNNITLNTFSNIELLSIAIANNEREMEIDAGNFGTSRTNIFSKAKSERLKIKTTSFTNFIKTIENPEKIRFIKIDCEGAEYLFLKDVYKFIKEKNVMVHISYHPWVIKKPEYYFIKLFHWVNQIRFTRYYFTADGSLLVKRPYSPQFLLNGKFPMADVIES